MTAPYAELRCHSAFSFGDGACTPEALVEHAARMGYAALGLTDTADLGGVIRFALAARRRGIRPVVGAEFRVDGHPVALLARDERGFKNLAALVTRARVGELAEWEGAAGGSAVGGGAVSGSAVSGSAAAWNAAAWSGAVRNRGQQARGAAAPGRGRPTLTFADVVARNEGLIALTGPAEGRLARLLRSKERSEAAWELARWKGAFGERLGVEVQLHHVSGAESALATALIELAGASRTRWVVANDPRYLDTGSRLVHDLLTALRADMDIDTAAAWGVLHPNGEWRLKSPAEMSALWKGRQAGLEETQQIALECDFDLGWLRPPLPVFPVPEGHDDLSFLREVAFAGARTRWGELDARQEAQLEHELGVIGRLGFAGFFLVMWDAVRFARERGILCQGRGSAANSAVAYVLGITAVDPVRHGLLFERFLSEVRTDGLTEAPDIDVDFEMHRREEVLDYMYEHYGREHAAITAVTQTYHAPSAVQDAMRALGFPAQLAFTLSKRLQRVDPSEGAAVLEAGLAERHGLSLWEPRGRAILAAMRAMDEVPRMRSTHPGGFVLSALRLGDYLPIEHTTMGRTILQFDKDDLDSAGVPKFDFLGLGGLSVVHRAFEAIERRTGEKLELYRLPTDDPATYEMISRGDTVGTFQIESRAQIQSLLQTCPDRLYDIVVQVALIRPGPIQARFVHPYTRRRRGLEPVRYAHPALEPILQRTQGIPIFQEQAMAISMALGGFSAAEADELRRSMGHRRKIPKLKAALEHLRRRIVGQGVDESIAQQVVDDMLGFANYGFPESHAWSFGLIAYTTAYLKAHYPAEFLLGLLNSWPMGFYPPATLVHDARRAGVVVLGPCMRDGQWESTIVDPAPGDTHARHPAVRVGWSHIRGLGERAREALQAAHLQSPFTSIDDVVRRAGLSRAESLHLARSGAFEAFEPGRRKAAWEALRVAGDLLPLAPARRLPLEVAELEGQELIFLDYLATGISTHGHPLEHLRERLRRGGVSSSAELPGLRDGQRVVVAGLVVARQHPETAKGTVFVLLEDEGGFINVIVSPKLYEQNREVVKFAPFLVVEGRFERDGQALNIVGRRFRELTAPEIRYPSRDFH